MIAAPKPPLKTKPKARRKRTIRRASVRHHQKTAANPVTRYAADVLSGEIVACKWVRLACQRHIDDLADPRFWFDEEAAQRALDFFPLMRHWKGSLAGKPFTLEPWQQFIVGALFGWKWRIGERAGYRRFKTAYVEVPRKNGKTTLAAGIALYMMVADGEMGAEVYFVATKEDQAKIGWKCCAKIVKRSPDFQQNGEPMLRCKVKEIEFDQNDSVCRPLGSDSDTLDGLDPYSAVLDELHAWKDANLREVVVEGMGARLEPLLFQITTAGYNVTGPCAEERAHTTNVLEGTDSFDDPTYFGIIYTVDKLEEAETETGWLKSNPNLGVSVVRSALAEKVLEMNNRPSKRNGILNKRFNVWTTAAKSWLDYNAFREGRILTEIEDPRARRAELMHRLEGETCYGGLDLSEKIDLTSLALWFPRYNTSLEFYWLPERTMERHVEEHRSLYPLWREQGWIDITEGTAVDYGVVRSDIRALAQRFHLKQLAYDPWKATETGVNLAARGIQTVECRQGARTLSEPSYELEGLVLSHEIYHLGNPITEWCARNVTIKSDENENIRPVKPPRDTGLKIDGIVAMIMALSRSISAEPKGPNVYETHGIRTL